MRIAIFSDIHGNSIALDAVLADIQTRGGVDEYWILGDLVAIGHDPLGVLERLSKLPNAHLIRGNTDRYVTSDDQPPQEWVNEVKKDTSQLPQLITVTRSMTWTRGAVSVAGWFDWLAALPLDRRFTLPNGTRVLCVHASPGTDEGRGMNPWMTDDELWELLKECDADLVFVGHTHQAQDRTVNGVRLINPSSVSNPIAPDLRAGYVLLTADEKGYRLEQRRVDYDHESVVEAIQKIKHPAAELVTQHLRGQQLPRL
ncbi:MAG: metallophosphoesterase family protein [Chloroflexi bacterium]|nr:metallophosphoesterase family protein [Chloroflexota bacterium]